MATRIIPLKQCTRKENCIHPDGPVLPATIEYFYTYAPGEYGIEAECKHCRRDRSRRHYTANPEQGRENAHRWGKSNPDKVRERSRLRRVTNLEYMRAAVRRSQNAHPDRKNTNTRNRRARKRAAEGMHTAADIAAQLKRQKSKCYWCGCKLIKYHVDHVIPLVRGGWNDPSNLVIACPHCNDSKGAKLPHEWEGSGGRLL